jgi:hypothetical protein
MSDVTVIDGKVLVNVSIVDNSANISTTVQDETQTIVISPTIERINVNVTVPDSFRSISVTQVDNTRNITITVSPEVLARLYMDQTKIYRDQVILSSKTIFVSETPPPDPEQNTLWLDISQS